MLLNTYNLFLIIFFIFILFSGFQIYFYNQKYKKNNEIIRKMESFQNNIQKYSEYTLDDNSLEKIMTDYDNIKQISIN